MNQASESNGDIINCDLEFDCPQEWAKLVPTQDERVRHCAACGKGVTFCSTMDELSAAAGAGLCVAFSRHGAQPLNLDRVRLGLPHSAIVGWGGAIRPEK